MFSGASKFNGNINWKISPKVAYWCFFEASSFNGRLDNWDISNLESLGSFFAFSGFNNDSILNWDISNVVNMIEMFKGCKEFNVDLSSWEVGHVDCFDGMFEGAKSLKYAMDNWKINGSCENMFLDSGILDSIKEESSNEGIELESNENFEDQISKNIERDKDSKIRISLLNSDKINHTNFIQLNENKELREFLGEWVPDSILKNCDVFVSLVTENADGDLTFKADKEKWNLAIIELFNFGFFIDKSGFGGSESARELKLKIKNEFTINPMQTLPDDLQQNKQNYLKHNDLSVLLKNNELLIAKPHHMQRELQDITIAYTLAKSYRAKMNSLNEEARSVEKTGDKINKSSVKKLSKIQEDICWFDLHGYLNMPVIQQNVNNTFLMDLWRKMARFYLVSESHDELNNTITQIAELLKKNKKDKEALLISLAALGVAAASLIVAFIQIVTS